MDKFIGTCIVLFRDSTCYKSWNKCFACRWCRTNTYYEENCWDFARPYGSIPGTGSFAQFGSELDESSKEQLERGKRLTRILIQKRFEPVPIAEQIIIIYAGISGLTDKISIDALPRFEKELITYIKDTSPQLYTYLGTTEAWTDNIKKELESAINSFLGEKWREGK
jgi:hypothetical protein